MTDKHIIIDGVDVSGCEYYNKDDKTCREVNGNYDIDICEFDKCENSNCHYKQLQLEKQECERFKQTLTEIKEITENREIFCENCTCEVEDFTCNDCGYVKILQKICEYEVK